MLRVQDCKLRNFRPVEKKLHKNNNKNIFSKISAFWGRRELNCRRACRPLLRCLGVTVSCAIFSAAARAAPLAWDKVHMSLRSQTPVLVLTGVSNDVDPKKT